MNQSKMSRYNIMKSMFRAMAAVIVLISVSVTDIKAQETENMPAPMEQLQLDDEAMQLVSNMLGRYVAWNNAEFNGKVRIPGLSISPGIKIYMERGRLLQVSLRVPLMGEVGRLEIDGENLLIINKWKRNYCRESLSRILEVYPGIIADIQSLLLGRVVIIGSGELNVGMLQDIILEPGNDGEWALAPLQMAADGKIIYGYLVKENGRTSMLYGGMDGGDQTLTIKYTYPSSSMNMEVQFNGGKKNYSALIDFSSIRWGGSAMTPVNLDKGYTRLGIDGFLRNLK